MRNRIFDSFLSIILMSKFLDLPYMKLLGSNKPNLFSMCLRAGLVWFGEDEKWLISLGSKKNKRNMEKQWRGLWRGWGPEGFEAWQIYTNTLPNEIFLRKN